MLSLGERWQLWAEARLPPARPAGRALGAPPLPPVLGRAASSAIDALGLQVVGPRDLLQGSRGQVGRSVIDAPVSFLLPAPRPEPRIRRPFRAGGRSLRDSQHLLGT